MIDAKTQFADRGDIMQAREDKLRALQKDILELAKKHSILISEVNVNDEKGKPVGRIDDYGTHPADHFGAAQEGYKETLAQAREDSLQEGFGDGFKEGFKQGLRSGKLIGLAT